MKELSPSFKNVISKQGEKLKVLSVAWQCLTSEKCRRQEKTWLFTPRVQWIGECWHESCERAFRLHFLDGLQKAIIGCRLEMCRQRKSERRKEGSILEGKEVFQTTHARRGRRNIPRSRWGRWIVLLHLTHILIFIFFLFLPSCRLDTSWHFHVTSLVFAQITCPNLALKMSIAVHPILWKYFEDCQLIFLMIDWWNKVSFLFLPPT